MLTQNRILNNISNNLANQSTPGYKQDYLLTSTFDEEMQIRTGNIDKSSQTDLATASMLRTVDEVYTDFEQGSFNDTGRSLDFAINGDAFFEITADSDGTTYYTRNGSFTLDEDGNLWLQHIGLVMGTDDQPINLGTDKVNCDTEGNIYNEEGTLLGTIKLVEFVDRDQLLKTDEGMFINQDAANISNDSTSTIVWQNLENSNSSLVEAMTNMISAERAFQSASQVLKMYDELLQQTVTEIARLD